MAKQDEVILLDFWPSMYGMRVRIALAEKGVSYEYKEENFPNNKSQLLLEMNPIHKQIPVLIHNGKPVCESSIIVEYIDEEWKDKAPLFPSDTYGKARARFWVDFIDKKVYPNGWKLYATKGEQHESARKEFIDSLKLIEQELGDKPYFGGESLGCVDATLIPLYAWLHSYETYGKLNVKQNCPKLIAWSKRCFENNESVSKTLPESLKVLAFVQQMRKRLGLDI